MDDKKEREHCERAFNTLPNTVPWRVIELLMRERAAAVAEKCTKFDVVVAEYEKDLDAKHAQLVAMADKFRALQANHDRIAAEVHAATEARYGTAAVDALLVVWDLYCAGDMDYDLHDVGVKLNAVRASRGAK